ncbi:RNA polymerase-binding protein DksA [Luteimonas sp. A277]
MATKKTVKKSVSKGSAAKAPVKKAASTVAKKAAAKKTAATSKVAVKTPVKKAAAKKAAVKKAAVKKSATKKVAVKKAPVKTAAKKAAATKAPAKQAPAKKAAVKKAAAKKAVAKKAVVKKAAAKKAAAKKATRPTPVRSRGKVAVAVTARQSAPAVKTKYKVVEHDVDKATGRPIIPKGYKPGVDEEYMSPLQLEYFRYKLLSRREELVDESRQTIQNLRGEVRDVGDEAERASRETENALELRTRDRYRKLISKIESIIRRVDEGDYGYCVETGEEIGLERLEARPEAERTIDAQERWEHLRKQMGD